MWGSQSSVRLYYRILGSCPRQQIVAALSAVEAYLSKTEKVSGFKSVTATTSVNIKMNERYTNPLLGVSTKTVTVAPHMPRSISQWKTAAAFVVSKQILYTNVEECFRSIIGLSTPKSARLLQATGRYMIHLSDSMDLRTSFAQLGVFHPLSSDAWAM